MLARQDGNDFEIRNATVKALYRALQNRDAVQFHKLFGSAGSHPGSASSGDKNCVNFSIHLGSKLSFFPIILSTFVSYNLQ